MTSTAKTPLKRFISRKANFIKCSSTSSKIQLKPLRTAQLSVNLVKYPRIQCRTYINEEFLCIDITDNGSGIVPENTQRIFSAGFTTKEQGSGLGLHSSANFVISSGGRIQPISTGKGKGTTMRVMLPYQSIQTSKERNRIATGGGG